MSAASPMLACAYCDALYRDPEPPTGSGAYCRRCDALLYRNVPDRATQTRALALAAWVTLLVANLLPILSLEMQGQQAATTLWHAVQTLWRQERPGVAALVFATTMMFPAIELAAVSYLVWPARPGGAAPGSALILRGLQAVRPWGMVEVFMLGVLVSLVKLAGLARVEAGVALWSFGALMLLLAAIAATFDARRLWQRIPVQA